MTLEQPAMDKQMTAKSEILKKLFFSTFYLSAFTFGGGYVIITLLKQKFVDELHWISEDEMLDLVALAQSSPGPIAVNGAILVGYKLAGIPGVLTSVLGAVIPPFVILTLISSFYTVFKSNLIIKTLLTGMKAGVAAVIMSVVFDMMTGVTKSKDPALVIVMIAAFLANFVFHINVVFIILLTAAFGAFRTVQTQKSTDHE
jgi:chromate transporter